jgi:hypothetical protein
MNHRAAADGVPLVRPMYHLSPADPRAYEVPNQFAFGSELVVAPVTTPRDAVTLRAAVRAWLPPGRWVDVFTETVYAGDRMVELHRDGASIPALLRAGGVLALAAEDEFDAAGNPARLEVLIAPGADGELVLVEDDGTGTTPDDIPTARTPLRWRQAEGVLEIEPVQGAGAVVPETRSWTVRVLGTGFAETVESPADRPLRVEVGADPVPETPARSDRLFALLRAAQYDHEAKDAAWRTVQSDLPAAAQLAELHAQGLPRALVGALAELVTAR